MGRHALFSYRYSDNLGDEVQSLAAKQFLPSIDYYVERDDLDEVSVEAGTRIIANGWYSHRFDTWPPKTRNLNPLFIAFHLTDKIRPAFATPETIAYLKEYEPIGCRDHSTMEFLKSHGVQSYFSGCLTLTLPKRNVPKTNKIMLVNMPEEFESYVPSDLRGDLDVDNTDYRYFQLLRQRIRNKLNMSSSTATFGYAEKLLDKFASARMVVTTRLHCAMPCLAMGVPVYFVVPNPDDTRFHGLVENANFLSLDDLRANPGLINWHEPAVSPGSIVELRKNLTQTCETFIKTGERPTI